MAQKMDNNRYRFPRYVGDADLQPTPSYWPLSQMRSSAGERDMSPESETYDRMWLDNTMFLIPYEEQTIKNLTGRSIQESLARLDRDFMQGYPDDSSPPPLDVYESPNKSRRTHPYYPHREHCYRPADAPATSKVAAAMESEEETNPRQRRSSRASELSDEVSSMVLDERDAILRHSTCASADRIGGDQNIDKARECVNPLLDAENLATGYTSITTSQLRVIRHPPTPTSPKETAPPCSVSHPSMSISNILNHDIRQLQTPEPSTVLQPITVIQKQDEKCGPSKEGIRRLPHRQSAPTSFDVEQPEDDDDPTDSFHETLNGSNVNALAKPKAKQKFGEQGCHICKICDKTFTRNFDLQRHNQRHNKEETNEDKARRTCTNCDRLLSRVDATKRHVDTLPDSCNHIRKKEGKMMLPPMPQSHYDICKAKYYKLAQETKKPKGRKKAVAVP